MVVVMTLTIVIILIALGYGMYIAGWQAGYTAGKKFAATLEDAPKAYVNAKAVVESYESSCGCGCGKKK